MGVIVKRYRVQTGERVYLPGEVINGLSDTDERQLVDDGYCRYPDSPQLAVFENNDGQGNQGSGSSNLEGIDDPLTLEQFEELQAGQQKEYLEKIGLEAGSNKAERIEQYAGWLAEQEDDLGEGRPNTSLPGLQ